MSNIDQMNLIATKQADQRAERAVRLSEPPLPDVLAGLYGALKELREKVKPEDVPFHQLLRHTLKPPIATVLEQKEAERLDGAVRRALKENALRFVPDWEEAAHLPLNTEHLVGVPMLAADASAVASFLDAKMVVLRRIIAELREGR